VLGLQAAPWTGPIPVTVVKHSATILQFKSPGALVEVTVTTSKTFPGVLLPWARLISYLSKSVPRMLVDGVTVLS